MARRRRERRPERVDRAAATCRDPEPDSWWRGRRHIDGRCSCPPAPERRWKVLPGYQTRYAHSCRWLRLRSYATEEAARAAAETILRDRPLVTVVRVYSLDWSGGRVDEYTADGMVERDLLAEARARGTQR